VSAEAVFLPSVSGALPHSFYDRATTEVARDLLGRFLVHQTAVGVLAGTIVETEAYGPADPANHAFRGMTKRNMVMFGPPGMLYVYRIYGMYWCCNAVTGREGLGEAVLIRALDPLIGLDVMRHNRGIEDVRLLCKGPGRLCMALGITGERNGADLAAGPVYIAGSPQPDVRVIATGRVGISQAADLPWRYYVADSPYVSRR
jgi:DNA-3-methyladenine glycosylase